MALDTLTAQPVWHLCVSGRRQLDDNLFILDTVTYQADISSVCRTHDATLTSLIL